VRHVGSDDEARVRSKWQDTTDRFERHLQDPRGPTTGQAQYEPWYKTGTPISRYLFVTSATFANPAQKDRLKKEIRECFGRLAGLPHLGHLSGLRVEVSTQWANRVGETVSSLPSSPVIARLGPPTPEGSAIGFMSR
jgi:hypothetical protein